MGMGRCELVPVPWKHCFSRCWWAAKGMGRDGHGPLWAGSSAAEALFFSLLVGRALEHGRREARMHRLAVLGGHGRAAWADL